MSDPFETFESAFTNGETVTKVNSDDPAAEFLAREQAELEKIENNGFEDFNGASELNNGSESHNTNGFSNDMFDALSLNDNKNEDQNQKEIDSEEQENNQSNDVFSAISRVDKLSQEPEKIKLWREEQRARLQTKDAEEENKRKEWKESAKKELEDWYKNRQEQLAKTHSNNKVNNKAAEAELVAPRDGANGTEWERMNKLCDFNPKANKNTKDVSRMRSILLHLKQQPLVRPVN
jgi:hypothetical protein